MGVRKFRSFEALKAAEERDRRERGVDWEVAARLLAPRGDAARREPGVYKHRTVEEWNAQTDAWEQQAIDRAQRRNQRVSAM